MESKNQLEMCNDPVLKIEITFDKQAMTKAL